MCYECFLALCNFLIWMLYLFCHLEGEVIDMDPVVIGALITTVGLLVTNFINDIRVGKKALKSYELIQKEIALKHTEERAELYQEQTIRELDRIYYTTDSSRSVLNDVKHYVENIERAGSSESDIYAALMVFEKHTQNLGKLYKEINNLKERIQELTLENDSLKLDLQTKEAELETLSKQIEDYQHDHDLEL